MMSSQSHTYSCLHTRRLLTAPLFHSPVVWPWFARIYAVVLSVWRMQRGRSFDCSLQKNCWGGCSLLLISETLVMCSMQTHLIAPTLTFYWQSIVSFDWTQGCCSIVFCLPYLWSALQHTHVATHTQPSTHAHTLTSHDTSDCWMFWFHPTNKKGGGCDVVRKQKK